MTIYQILSRAACLKSISSQFCGNTSHFYKLSIGWCCLHFFLWWCIDFSCLVVFKNFIHNLYLDTMDLENQKIADCLRGTVNVLGKYVLSNPYVAVHIFSKHAAWVCIAQYLLVEQVYHYIRVVKNILVQLAGNRCTVHACWTSAPLHKGH